MKWRGVVCVGLAAIAAAASAALHAAPSAAGPPVKITRWEITARVASGSQILTRITNSSTPQHTGAGAIESSWSARWRVKVRIAGPDVVIIGANGFNVIGTSTGEYRGRYPKNGGLTGTYTCPFGPIKAAKVLKKLKLSGVGRTNGPVHVSIGVNGEPGILPTLVCTGDLVETDVAKTLSAGILTGIESACFGNAAVSGAKLKKRVAFALTKRFGWHPPSPAGVSRPCNGFGSPIWSAGTGTLKLTFHPVT